MQRLVIWILFFGSGLTGLTYQVVWTKLLTLTFGVTVLAVSTVLTCFFGGLALGGYLGGRWVDKFGDGFKWYGLAELLIGVYALVFGLLLALNNTVYVFIAQRASLDFFGLSLLKFVLAAMLLIIPTTLMGATLPILSKTLARKSAGFARAVGGLYSVNTLGALTGVVLTAFILIPSLGISKILLGAGLLNIAIGIVAFILHSKQGVCDDGSLVCEPSEPEPAVESGTGEAGELSSGFMTLLIWGFALSGFTGLVYEVIWTRILGFLLVGTVYAFASVLAVFLVGIASGSLVFSVFIDRFKRSTIITIFAVIEALIGLCSIALIRVYDGIPGYKFYETLQYTTSWSEWLYVHFFMAFITLIIPTFLFGATFPLVCKVYSWRVEGVGRKIGNVYAVNTVGGIVGSFAAGFILIPILGMQNVIIFIGCINILLGIVFILANPLSSKGVRYGFSAASIVVAIIIIATLPANMPLSLHKTFLQEGEESIYYREGPAATVMIGENKSKSESFNKKIWVNGSKATASYYEGLQINRFQGVLPMVLHPDPKEVLVICFGSGTTFGTLSQFPGVMVDNVEISKSVIGGAHNFKIENMDVLNNPQSRINIDDGRSFLAVTDRKFDVITEEPMHPGLAGVINLYTTEYYELAKSHLKPGGIISQWIPLYMLSIEDVQMLTATFQSVFPHTSIWIANADIFLIGSEEKLVIDFERIVERLELPNIKRLLTDTDMENPYEFLSTFMMNEDIVREYTKGFEPISDDLPVVEFTSARSFNVNTVTYNIDKLLRYREPVSRYLKFAPDRENSSAIVQWLNNKYTASHYNLVGRAYLSDANIKKAAENFYKALEYDSTDRNSIHYLENIKLVF